MSDKHSDAKTPGLREAIAIAICKSGKFETGEGTCAFLCMDQLGSARKGPCKHAVEIHSKLTDAIIAALAPGNAGEEGTVSSDRASTIEECAKVADDAAARYADGPVEPGNHLRFMTARWIAKGIRVLAAQLPKDRVCQKCGAQTNGEEALVDGQIWCHPCADKVTGPVSRANRAKEEQ